MINSTYVYTQGSSAEIQTPNTMEPDQSQHDPDQPLMLQPLVTPPSHLWPHSATCDPPPQPLVTPPSHLWSHPAVFFLHLPLIEFSPPQGKKWIAFKNVFQNFLLFVYNSIAQSCVSQGSVSTGLYSFSMENCVNTVFARMQHEDFSSNSVLKYVRSS